MWPKKPNEKTEDFAYADDPEFSTIRRKLARWASDNVRIIKDLKPLQPPGLTAAIRWQDMAVSKRCSPTPRL